MVHLRKLTGPPGAGIASSDWPANRQASPDHGAIGICDQDVTPDRHLANACCRGNIDMNRWHDHLERPRDMAQGNQRLSRPARRYLHRVTVDGRPLKAA